MTKTQGICNLSPSLIRIVFTFTKNAQTHKSRQTHCGFIWCPDREHDFPLQPCIARVPSFTWDTTKFMNKRQRLLTLPSEFLLVTLDVFSLWTNVLHDEGIAACVKALNLRESPAPPTADIYPLIQLILTKISLYSIKKLFTNARYCHGHLYGSISHKLVNGKVGIRVPAHLEQQTSSVVVVVY